MTDAIVWRQNAQRKLIPTRPGHRVTQGVRLNDFVGREFEVGAVRMRLSEPCMHLVRLTHPEKLRGLVHRACLVAEVLNDAELTVGDAVKVEGRKAWQKPLPPSGLLRRGFR